MQRANGLQKLSQEFFYDFYFLNFSKTSSEKTEDVSSGLPPGISSWNSPKFYCGISSGLPSEILKRVAFTNIRKFVKQSQIFLLGVVPLLGGIEVSILA